MAYDPGRKVYIGEVERRGQTVRFGIKEEDRARHIYVIGQTGAGKSKLLEIMAQQDIANGEGLIFIDPHGQSVDQLLEYIDEESLDRVVYLAPHLQDHPIGLNIMEDIGYDRRHLVVSSLMAAFEKIWGSASWSDRMAYILQNTLLALIEYPGTTLLDVGRMYSNKSFRTKVVDNVKDPQVRRYWVDEFENYNERYVQDATPAIQNKLGQFTANPLMRNIIGQTKSAFDFRQIMDEGKALLINLSKGQIGENNARMLGVLFTTKIYLAALSRGDLSRQDLADAAPCNFYVDEFQSFANSSFAGILSEARKYKLNLVLAHQYIGQLYSDDGGDGNSIRDAVFGNVGSFISFRVGPVDAEIIAKQFAPHITEEDLVTQPRRHMYLTLNIDGAGSPPFSARTFNAPDPPPVSLAEKVIEQSLERYGTNRSDVERQVRENMEQDWKNAGSAGKGKQGGKGMDSRRKAPITGNVRRSAASPAERQVDRKGVRTANIAEQGSLRTAVKSIFQRSQEGVTGGEINEKDRNNTHLDSKNKEEREKKVDEGGILSPMRKIVVQQKSSFQAEDGESKDRVIIPKEDPIVKDPVASQAGEELAKEQQSDKGNKKHSNDKYARRDSKEKRSNSENKGGQVKRDSGEKTGGSETKRDFKKKKRGARRGRDKGRQRNNAHGSEKKGQRNGHNADRRNERSLQGKDFSTIVRSAQSSGFKKDIRVPKKKTPPAPPTNYNEGWVSFNDLGKAFKSDSKDE